MTKTYEMENWLFFSLIYLEFQEILQLNKIHIYTNPSTWAQGQYFRVYHFQIQFLF